MNAFIERRLEDFKQYFHTQDKQTQLGLISGYYSSSVSQILSGRMYCRFLTYSFIDNGDFSVGEKTIESFLDEVERFFQKKINKIYEPRERNLEAFIVKAIRTHERQHTR